jgi:hypothetical protein
MPSSGNLPIRACWRSLVTTDIGGAIDGFHHAVYEHMKLNA